MAVYTSRFSNPELRKGCYTTVRIALGAPRWDAGYRIDGEMKDLMPFGLKGKYDYDMPAFKREYLARLDRVGVDRIQRQLMEFERKGQDVVLLCWEDVRKGPNDWCHRTMFAEWWLQQTGEIIEELPDSSKPPASNPPKATKQPIQDVTPKNQQLNLFEHLNFS